MTLPTQPPVDYYLVLGVQRTSNIQEIKHAYHRQLLSLHPDRIPAEQNPVQGFDAALLKEAYRVLSSPDLRAKHDELLVSKQPDRTPSNQRPAHIISLAEFDESPSREGEWTVDCRCGSAYRITEAQMEDDVHLIGCDGCSETIWVGYEAVEDE